MEKFLSKTGVNRIDYRIKGLHKGSVGIIGGALGVGKTVMMMNIAINNYKAGNNGIYLSDNFISYTNKRAISCTSGLTINDIGNPKNSEMVMVSMGKLNQMNNLKLCYKTKSIESHIDDYLSFNPKLDYIVLDSVGKLDIRDVDKLAIKYDIAVWVSLTTRRDSDVNKVNSIFTSNEPIQIASLCCVMEYEDEEMHDYGIINFNIIKNRYGDNKNVELNFNTQNSQIS